MFINVYFSSWKYGFVFHLNAFIYIVHEISVKYKLNIHSNHSPRKLEHSELNNKSPCFNKTLEFSLKQEKNQRAKRKKKSQKSMQFFKFVNSVSFQCFRKCTFGTCSH